MIRYAGMMAVTSYGRPLAGNGKGWGVGARKERGSVRVGIGDRRVEGKSRSSFFIKLNF
jgi:hypothetical protein